VLDGIEGALPTLGGIDSLPVGSSTGTSRRANRAGKADSRVRYSVRILPVTFLRISRGLSRSWIWK
jgi:hypothetical protein